LFISLGFANKLLANEPEAHNKIICYAQQTNNAGKETMPAVMDATTHVSWAEGATDNWQPSTGTSYCQDDGANQQW